VVFTKCNIMKLNLSLLVIICAYTVSFSQKGSFSVTVDKDTIFQNEVIKLEFLLENLSGRFLPPDFESFNIVSGPNTSSSISIINGETNQKKTYSYILVPEKAGGLVIGRATVANDTGELNSEPIDIFVLGFTDKSSQSQSHKRTFRYDTDSKDIPSSKDAPKKRVMKKI
jgi:hypothetical protein